ncbi:MAG: M56 family metallopeptidase [Pirellula sp.]|jgi:beta-lactamase regulating signal transducer with metallopeptidase domain
MQFLLLSKNTGILVLNLVVASLAISMVALAASRLVRKRDSLRHSILCIGILLMAVSPLSIIALNSMGYGFVLISQPSNPTAIVNAVVSRPSENPASLQSQGLESTEVFSIPMEKSSSLKTANVMQNHDLESESRWPNVEEVASNATVTAQPALRGAFTLSVSLFVVVWLVVATALLYRLVRSFLILRRLRQSICTTTSRRLSAAEQRMRLEWKISTSVVESSLAPTPLTMGYLRPVILIPEGLVSELDDEELDCVLSHEAAHVVRHDTSIALLQQLVSVAFWWNPMLRAINKLINNIRERLCDAYVVQREGDGLTLARSLVKVAEWSSNRWSRLPLVASLLEEDGLEYRVSNLISDRPPATISMNRRSLILLAAFVFVLGGTSLIPLMRFGLAPVNSAEPVIDSPVQEAVNADIPKADPKSLAWPAGTTVSGRVVDHRGMAVENAEILLLGQERLVVDAGKKTWFDNESIRQNLPSTRTNANGEFSITREQGEADRIAVIANDPIFWVVPRSDLKQADMIELKLPAAGKLAVHCELPNNSPELPVTIESLSFDGLTWKRDILIFDSSNYSLVNPGEKIFEQLPPGQYAVQFHEKSKTDRSSTPLIGMDRKLVEVTSGSQSNVNFDRKIGRPLHGRVLGLENVELKCAFLTIRSKGPDEVWDMNGRRIRRTVAFGVIPIESNGQFTTDPIPPGKYDAELYAIRASTPLLSRQSSDFFGRDEFTVPEQGELPKVEIETIAKGPTSTEMLEDIRIRVIDEDGRPVSKMQATIHTADGGWSKWKDGRDGDVFLDRSLSYRTGLPEVLVRADGFASTFARFDGEQQRDKLRKGEATITLRRGASIQLHFRLPADMTWPKGMLPETYFDHMQKSVRMMRLSANRPAGRVADFNILNLRDIGDGRFEFRLADETPRFHTTIHTPNFLQFFEAGSFTTADVKNDRIEIEVPKPATMELTFEPGDHAITNGPFKSATLSIMPKREGNDYSMLISMIVTSAGDTLAPKLTVTDLAPGNYHVGVRTQPIDKSKPLPGSGINQGTFFEVREVVLAAGQHKRIDFRSVPYQPDAFHGTRTAILQIKTADGRPAAGRNIQVHYFDGHYGSQLVFDGPVPASGDIVLSGITDKAPLTWSSSVAYTVSCEGKSLGSIGFKTQGTTEVFEFSLIPAAGDLVPDVVLTNLATEHEINLSQFRGKVVLLEFWATWSAGRPEPMNNLNAMAAKHSPEWKNRVVILPVTIARSRKEAKLKVLTYRWRNLEHYWVSTNGTKDLEAVAIREFGITGDVPEAILIGPDGRIRWRGHPLEKFSGKSIESLINDALRESSLDLR